MLAARDRPTQLPVDASVKRSTARHGGRMGLAVRAADMVVLPVWSTCQRCSRGADMLCEDCESLLRYCAMSEAWTEMCTAQKFAATL